MLHNEELTTVSFASYLLEYVMVAAKTTVVRAGWQMGKFTILLGKEKIVDTTQEGALKKLLYFLLMKDIPMSMDELREIGKTLRIAENEEFTKKLETLTQGGMSDFGKWVEDQRKGRGEVILRAVSELMKEGKCKTTNDLLNSVREKTGIGDVELAEVALAYRDELMLSNRGTKA